MVVGILRPVSADVWSAVVENDVASHALDFPFDLVRKRVLEQHTFGW